MNGLLRRFRYGKLLLLRLSRLLGVFRPFGHGDGLSGNHELNAAASASRVDPNRCRESLELAAQLAMQD